jgi:hypothetical protein
MKRMVVVAVFLLVLLVPLVAQDAGTATSTSPGDLKPYAVEVNLLGVLQFGPYIRFHIQVADNVFISPHLRIGYAGALDWLLFGLGDVGAGTSFLVFLPSATRDRLYAGAFTEAAVNSNGDFVSSLGANIGYRWRFPGGSYWHTGVIAGISYNFSREFLFPFGMAELSWGREF